LYSAEILSAHAMKYLHGYKDITVVISSHGIIGWEHYRLDWNTKPHAP